MVDVVNFELLGYFLEIAIRHLMEPLEVKLVSFFQIRLPSGAPLVQAFGVKEPLSAVILLDVFRC